MKLTRVRNLAFLAMVGAAVAAFGTSTRAKGAGVPDNAEFTCGIGVMGTLDCEQSGGDPATCKGVAPDDQTANATCGTMCEAYGIQGRAVMASSCHDGPPLSFSCACGLPLPPG